MIFDSTSLHQYNLLPNIAELGTGKNNYRLGNNITETTVSGVFWREQKINISASREETKPFVLSCQIKREAGKTARRQFYKRNQKMANLLSEVKRK